jgi:hypothetical protein
LERVGNWRSEIGNWKLEIGNWKLEIGTRKWEIGNCIDSARGLAAAGGQWFVVSELGIGDRKIGNERLSGATAEWRTARRVLYLRSETSEVSLTGVVIPQVVVQKQTKFGGRAAVLKFS